MSTIKLPRNEKNVRRNTRDSRSPALGPIQRRTTNGSVEYKNMEPISHDQSIYPPQRINRYQNVDRGLQQQDNTSEHLGRYMNNLNFDDHPFKRMPQVQNQCFYRSTEGAVARATSLINISFLVMKGQVVQTQVNSNPSLAEFRKVIEDNVSKDYKGYRFIIASKQLDLEDSRRFDMQKSLIQNGVTIFVLQRMNGGATKQDTQSYMEIATLIDRITVQLPPELERSMNTTAICVACQETKKCKQLCCWPICAICFIVYYKTTNFNLKCTDCHKPIEPRRFFTSESFLKLINCLHQSRNMLQYINFQICRCGSLMSNDTMYSKQQCNACGRLMCFFCNKDWDSNTMSNVEYTCHNNCDYETKITYELVPCLEFDPNLMIPSRRTCPKCFYTGAFGGRCKYHDCYCCGYSFCFICLKSKENCQTKFNKTRNQEFHKVQCRDIKQQTYAMFPKIS